MRVDKPPFNDVRVRRALSLALDRKGWVARHLGGEGFEDDGPVPSPMRQWKLKAADLGAGAKSLEHDPALARRLLSEAGFPNGLRVRCTTWPGHGPEHVEDLEILVSEVTLAGLDPATVEAKRRRFNAKGAPAELKVYSLRPALA